MKIESASVIMNSTSFQKEVSQTTEHLRAWNNNQSTIQNTTENSLTATSQTKYTESEELSIPIGDQYKIRLLNKLLQTLLGRELKFLIPKRMTLSQPLSSTTYSQPIQAGQGQTMLGWGFDYQKQEYHSETETMNFNSSGTVKTSDGRDIQFGMNLTMSRSFESSNYTSIKAGDALIDPLVINFGQSSASLTQNKFSFDLDNDGDKDSISFANGGSGFLAFDKNNDGVINNGSELFGPGTGNGFIELAELDSDGNNWIDENDPIYDKLQIWTKNEDGTDQLFAIGEKGIGAIYLGSVKSTFSLKDNSNNTQGQIQEAGIFLRENGTTGTIQHVDISL